MLGASLHFAKITLHFPNLQGGDRFDLDCVRHVHPQKISVRGGSSLFEDTRLNCIFTKRKPTGHQATVAAPCYFCVLGLPERVHIKCRLAGVMQLFTTAEAAA